MFAIEDACKALPERLESLSSLEPGRVNPVPGAEDFATRHAFHAEMHIAACAHGAECLGEGAWAAVWQAEDFSERPSLGGPVGGGDEHGFLAHFSQRGGESEEIGLGSAGG